ncbi:MAG: hypothetical protein ACYDHG_13960 [Desulfomonilaceae bacterium]
MEIPLWLLSPEAVREMEAKSVPRLELVVSNDVAQRPLLFRENIKCLKCEHQVKGWCTAHPRNQFVNIHFIDECPRPNK